MASLDYSSYLRLEQLLDLQHPLSEPAEHDETLFIVIHQVYELWFKEVLHECEHLARALDDDQTVAAARTLQRLAAIGRVMNAQWQVLHTMSPAAFAAFRGALQRASGFQSAQFRELEFVLGKRDVGVLSVFPTDSAVRARLLALLDRPSLYIRFLRYIGRSGAPLSAQAVERTAADGEADEPEVLRALRTIYRERLAQLPVCEGMVDLDVWVQEWRYQHVKTVERFIGTRGGTGGSAGADYLRGTLFRPLFPALWRVRNEL